MLSKKKYVYYLVYCSFSLISFRHVFRILDMFPSSCMRGKFWVNLQTVSHGYWTIYNWLLTRSVSLNIEYIPGPHRQLVQVCSFLRSVQQQTQTGPVSIVTCKWGKVPTRFGPLERSIYLSARPSVCLPACLPIHPSNHTSTQPHIHPSTQPHIHSSNHTATQQHIHPPIHPPI
jgi:hypothetical protein